MEALHLEVRSHPYEVEEKSNCRGYGAAMRQGPFLECEPQRDQDDAATEEEAAEHCSTVSVAAVLFALPAAVRVVAPQPEKEKTVVPHLGRNPPRTADILVPLFGSLYEIQGSSLRKSSCSEAPMSEITIQYGLYFV